MVIYVITNEINGKKYVGQTIRDIEIRFTQHKYNARTDKTNCIIHKAIRKYGEENFNIKEIDTADSLDELNEKEIYWIDKLNTFKPNGYNMTIGGQSFYGTHTEETRRKMSELKKGENNPFYGKSHTEEAKEKMRRSRGPCPEHVKELNRKKFSKKVINLDTGEIYNSLTDVKRLLGIPQGNISNVCQGKRKTTGGYRWAYYDET